MKKKLLCCCIFILSIVFGAMSHVYADNSSQIIKDSQSVSKIILDGFNSNSISDSNKKSIEDYLNKYYYVDWQKELVKAKYEEQMSITCTFLASERFRTYMFLLQENQTQTYKNSKSLTSENEKLMKELKDEGLKYCNQVSTGNYKTELIK